MENEFFRNALPYCLKVDGGQLTVFNREYHPIFACRLPDGFKMDDLLAFSDEDGDSVKGNEGKTWMYNDNTSPIGESGSHIDEARLGTYYKRLSLLLRFMDGLEGYDPAVEELVSQAADIDRLKRIIEMDENEEGMQA